MARKSTKGGVNKSGAIREFQAANPNAGPAEVVAALKEKGVEVTSQFVSTIKSNDKRKDGKSKPAKRGRKPGSTVAAAAKSVGPMSGSELLLAAKKFVDSIGNIEKAKAAVDLLAQLRS